MSPLNSNSTYRLCIIGPLFGKKKGQVTTQSLILSELFTNEEFTVTSASDIQNVYLRLLDIVWTILSRTRKYDIVMLDIYSGRSMIVQYVVAMLAKLTGKKLIMFLHGGNLPVYSKEHPNTVKRLFKMADFIGAPSEYLAGFARNLGFKVSVIPNVIEMSDYNYIYREKVAPKLFWMRNFHPTWNPLMAIRVVDVLIKDYPDITLVMGGPDKGFRAECETLVKELNVRDHVSFPGFLDKEQKRKCFDNADIYLNTNKIDNTPLALIEASASGLPIVSTNVGGIPFLFKDSENAMLVESDDAVQMAGAVKRLIETPELANRLSENGRQFALTYSWENVMGQWKAVFDQLLTLKH